MDATMVEKVRRFGREVTRQVGALDERFASRGRPLAEARMLWEIGVDGCEIRRLRQRLGLDSGHASRLLRALEADGLVRVVPGEQDRRLRVARLTGRGLKERAVLDRRSDEHAERLLAPLDDTRRTRLVDAMDEVVRLLTAAAVDIREVDPASPDARQCMRAYFADLDRRSGTPYDPSAGVPAEPALLRPPLGRFLIAYLGAEPVGCGAVKHAPGAPSEIKRMWVAEHARGLGLGRRLLHLLEEIAAEEGARVSRLETNRTLVEAITLYRSAGYREVPAFNDEPFADHWFEKPLNARSAPDPGAA